MWCGGQQKGPAHILPRLWLTRAWCSPVTPTLPAASWMACSVVRSTMWPCWHTVWPVTVWSLKLITLWQVSYLIWKNMHENVYRYGIILIFSPPFRTLPTDQHSSQYGVWTTHCNCFLAAEWPRCGLCCILWQPEWTQRFLFWHKCRYTMSCIMADVWYSLQCLGESSGTAVQQLWQHHDHIFIRYILDII